MLEIEITGYRDACRRLRFGDRNYHVLSIRQSDHEDQALEIDKYLEDVPSVLRLYFDDISERTGFGVVPEAEHVREVLSWAEGKERFLVHCAAGISRSSAMAFAIACLHHPPEEALRYIDPVRHWPNRRLIELIAEVLEDPGVYEAFRRHPDFRLLLG